MSNGIACVADSGCNGYRPYDQGWGREPDYGWGREALPAINISWEDTQSYFVWLSRRRGVECRLPSEAEWEYAARAGTTTEYALPAPDGSNDIGASRTAPASKILANCSTCGGRFGSFRTAPVGRFPANAWGLHDMHGNVGEWVEDCLHKSYAGAPEDGRAWLKEGGDGDCPLRVVRSGSWAAPQDYARSATRSGYSPYHRDSTVGFRVACSSPINER